MGYLGNAATGVIFPITVVGWGVSLLFGDGATAALSVSLGRNETRHIHRSVGNSVLLSFLCGVVIVAIFVLDLGIKGAAYATILGQFVSFLICIAYFQRSKTFHISAKSFIPDFTIIKHNTVLGMSSFLTQLSIVVITIINNILLVKYGAASVYGADIPLAAFVVIMKLFQIVLNVAIGIAVGAQPIVGYNYGAGKHDRVKSLLRLVLKWTTVVCLICTALFEIIPLAFIQMFGADGELYTNFAVSCLRIYLSLIVFTCLQKACAIFLQSIGHAKSAAPLSILRDVMLIIFSLIIPSKLGVTGIFWAAPAADIVAAIITGAVMIKTYRALSGSGETVKESSAT